MSVVSEHGVPQVTPEEAAQRAEDGALLLDVRELDEWTAGHAPDAEHLPLSRLQAEHGSLPKDRPIVAVCRVGGRSEKAAVALRGAGYDVANLAGGMRAWAAAGRPVVTDGGATGTVI
jgi:rhodanese-related sulfurtransferase